jgi:hypothetical protein
LQTSEFFQRGGRSASTHDHALHSAEHAVCRIRMTAIVPDELIRAAGRPFDTWGTFVFALAASNSI